MRSTDFRNDILDAVDRGRSWDSFIGPAAIIGDDRRPADLNPLLFAAQSVAFAASLNARLIEGMVSPPKT